MLWATAVGAPRVPANDDTVLEHVPAASATRGLEPLRGQLAAHPDDLPTALTLAQGYLDIGRANADPRFVSYAEATLVPWMARSNPDPAVLTLAASTVQYLHRFDEALALLERALAAQPLNGQAWLTKATLLQVQGRFQESRKACQPLARIAGQLIALTCLTSVNSVTGQLAVSYMALDRVFTDDERLPSGIRIWIREQLADMAQRSGDDGAAEAHLKAALRVSAQDGSVKSDYADLLLRQQRNTEVIQMLRGDEQRDNLLLRLAIAGARLRTTDGARWSKQFQARYEASRRDGDDTHLREQARFLLEVGGQAAEALTLSQRNWQVQREPADVRIYAEAAAATGNQQAAHDILKWIRETNYEDRTLTSTATLSTMVSRQ
jgi:tetratricopeptide (TPR) repeat protein